MILDLKPLTLSQVQELTADLEDKPELRDYLKKFAKLLNVGPLQKRNRMI